MTSTLATYKIQTTKGGFYEHERLLSNVSVFEY